MLFVVVVMVVIVVASLTHMYDFEKKFFFLFLN
jgi:hypothetical protein